MCRHGPTPGTLPAIRQAPGLTAGGGSSGGTGRCPCTHEGDSHNVVRTAPHTSAGIRRVILCLSPSTCCRTLRDLRSSVRRPGSEIQLEMIGEIRAGPPQDVPLVTRVLPHLECRIRVAPEPERYRPWPRV